MSKELASKGCYSSLRTQMRRGLDARRNSAAIDLLLCCFEHSFLAFPLFLREIDKLEVTSERPRPQMFLVLMRSLESSPLTARNCLLQRWSTSTKVVWVSRSSRHEHSPMLFNAHTTAKREHLSWAVSLLASSSVSSVSTQSVLAVRAQNPAHFASTTATLRGRVRM